MYVYMYRTHQFCKCICRVVNSSGKTQRAGS